MDCRKPVMIWFSLSSIVYSVNPRGDYLVRFLHKNNNQTEFFLKKTETGSNRRGLVRFGYFKTKIETQLTGFDSVWFDFGLVRLFYIKNKKLYCFLGFFFCNL